MASTDSIYSCAPLKITLVYSPAPRVLREWVLTLPGTMTVAQALAACRIFQDFPELQMGSLQLGIWGRKSSLNHLLHDLDRIEIYRPLRVEPKVARRERFNRQGAKSAGLFATKRPGAKSGY
jgi:putative ubiquitin-RnfH superfamily antitoxin RatB of RatAB toxin-antitoxin module